MPVILVSAAVDEEAATYLLRELSSMKVNLLSFDACFDSMQAGRVCKFKLEGELTEKIWQILKRITDNRDYKISIEQNISRSIPPIRMFLTDCDGCLTDGGMYYSENGDELKKFNAKDGMAFERLRKKGIITGIVTGETRHLNERRAEKLKLDYYEPGVKDKLPVVKRLAEENDIPLSQVVYIGDDVNDLEVIKSVGFGCSVADGVKEVKQAAKYVTQSHGGAGAIREVVDLIIASNYSDTEGE